MKNRVRRIKYSNWIETLGDRFNRMTNTGEVHFKLTINSVMLGRIKSDAKGSGCTASELINEVILRYYFKKRGIRTRPVKK